MKWFNFLFLIFLFISEIHYHILKQRKSKNEIGWTNQPIKIKPQQKHSPCPFTCSLFKIDYQSYITCLHLHYYYSYLCLICNVHIRNCKRKNPFFFCIFKYICVWDKQPVKYNYPTTLCACTTSYSIELKFNTQ